MTVKTIADLKSEISTLLADNTSGDISPADVRTIVKNLADSAFILNTDDSDDITEGATNLFFTSAEQTKLSGIEAGADFDGLPRESEVVDIPLSEMQKYDSNV